MSFESPGFSLLDRGRRGGCGMRVPWPLDWQRKRLGGRCEPVTYHRTRPCAGFFACRTPERSASPRRGAFCCAGQCDSRRGAAAAAAETVAAPREKQSQDRSAIKLGVNDEIQKNYQARILRVAYFVPCRFDRFSQSLCILPRFATTRPLSVVPLSTATRPSSGRSTRRAGAVPPGQAAPGRGQREGWPH